MTSPHCFSFMENYLFINYFYPIIFDYEAPGPMFRINRYGLGPGSGTLLENQAADA